jgi:hypothetical protein
MLHYLYRPEVVMSDPILVREWNVVAFHQRVLELEAKGYVAKRKTYSITPEMNPETGEIIHLRVIEMFLPDPDADPL